MGVAHRKDVREIIMHLIQIQQGLQRLGDPGAMREHVQVGVLAGFRGPIVQCFDATSADLLLRFGAVFEFASAELGP